VHFVEIDAEVSAAQAQIARAVARELLRLRLRPSEAGQEADRPAGFDDAIVRTVSENIEP